jgi:CP family cyanate transporter-like MFS transporter
VVTPVSRNGIAGAALVGILAVALNLRLGILEVGPVIEDIRADLGMSSTVAGLLSAVPFLCMGVFAFAGVPLVRAIGAHRVITYSIWLMGLGALARGAMPSSALLVLATVPIGMGIALTSTAVPGVIKAHFPDRPGAVTGAYVAALSVGAGGVALAIVPLADALGGWRWAFAATAVPAAVALPLWQRAQGDESRPRVLPALRRELRRLRRTRRAGPSRLALRLAVMFGLQSACFAAAVSWVAALYTDAGWSAGEASLATATVPIGTIISSLTVPGLSDGRDRRHWIVGMSAMMTVGLAGIAFAPTTAAWLWLSSFSLGAGGIFPLHLTLPLDLRETETEIAELTGWMLGIGYLISGISPAVVGALRDISGDFTLPMALVAACGAASGLLAVTGALRPRPRAFPARRGPLGAADPAGADALLLATEQEPRPDDDRR